MKVKKYVLSIKNVLLKHKLYLLRLMLLTLVLIVLLVLYKVYGFAIPCPIHLATGLYCPGCGITRCLVSIAEFNFYQAFRYNPLVFCLIPLFVFYSVTYWILKISGKNTNKFNKYVKFIAYIILIITILFGILRNLPQFEFLAPI
jgi:hypothetical protein